MKHDLRCECYYCTHTPEEIEQKQQNALKQYGFWVDGLTNDCACPYGFNFHTHGLPQSFNHPDIQIVFRIDPDMAMNILHHIVDYIKNGRKFESGVTYTDTDPKPLKFIDAYETDRLVLRLLIPNSSGEYTGEFAKQLTMLEYLEP